MRIIDFHKLPRKQSDGLLRRPSTDFSDIDPAITTILKKVETKGDAALRELTLEFDKVDVRQSVVTDKEIEDAAKQTDPAVRDAIQSATGSLRAFHAPQRPAGSVVETVPGVKCRLEWRPIQRVGLYVPGGSAPLISTVLMLAIPAAIAGCPDIILCTPPRRDGTISPDILFAAQSLGMTNIFKVGGAQAIAAMAVGTESIQKAVKIFGPGNRYVTAMKSMVSRPPYNVGIDTLAGPSELLVIADESANAAWVAADLISQAEHGADSPVILVTWSTSLAQNVTKELERQVSQLPRRAIASQALKRSFVLLVDGIDEAVDFSNSYAPEHLVLAISAPESVSSRITNAGSVFLGGMTSVVFGDYASGANHTLPTGGLAISSGGLTVMDFMKPIFFQSVDNEGLKTLSSTVKALARAEGLEGHASAVEVREQIP